MSRSATRHFSPERLKEAQAATGLSNEALARDIGCSLRLLQKWRAGTVTPSGRYLLALAVACGVPMESFYVTTEAAA